MKVFAFIPRPSRIRVNRDQVYKMFTEWQCCWQLQYLQLVPRMRKRRWVPIPILHHSNEEVCLSLKRWYLLSTLISSKYMNNLRALTSISRLLNKSSVVVVVVHTPWIWQRSFGRPAPFGKTFTFVTISWVSGLVFSMLNSDSNKFSSSYLHSNLGMGFSCEFSSRAWVYLGVSDCFSIET